MKTAALVASLLAAGSRTSVQADVIAPSEMQKMMGLGINLGNRIDLWDQEPMTVKEHFFEQFAQAGFTNVRIPVCWHMRTNETAPYTINEDFLQSVEQMVDWSLSRGMVTILNAHHELWLDNSSAFEAGLPRFEAIWSQIATRFASKNQTLLFEIFNEPHLMTADQLNKMNGAILPIIRKSNPTRIVFLGGLKFMNPSWFAQNPDALTIPDDKQVMLEIHNYDPWPYAGGKPSVHSWGSDADRQALSSWMDGIDSWAKNHSLNIYYGEFGITNDQNASTGRDDWFKAHYDEITKRGWAASVWSDGGGHMVYDYSNYSFVNDILLDLGRKIPPPSPAPPADRCCHGPAASTCSQTAMCVAKTPFCASSKYNCESKCNGHFCPGDTPAPTPAPPGPVARCCHGPKGCDESAYCPAKPQCTASEAACTTCNGTWCPGKSTTTQLIV